MVTLEKLLERREVIDEPTLVYIWQLIHGLELDGKDMFISDWSKANVKTGNEER